MVGQVVGDTKAWTWNATKAIPVILQCALALGAAPKLIEEPLWLIVDVVAALSDAPTGVMDVMNRKLFHWTRDLLPMPRQAMPVIDYEAVERRAWEMDL